MRLNRRQLLTSLAAMPFVGRAGSAMASTNLSYWHHFTSQTEFTALQKISGLFRQKFPGIQLSPEGIPNADFMTKISAAVLTGRPPDTIMVEPDRLLDLVSMKTLVDLTDRYNAWPSKAIFPGERIASMTVAERVYGVPSFAFVDWAYYRTDYFEKAGLYGPPTNFDEFLTTCEKLTDASSGRFGFGLRGGAGAHLHVINVIEAFGSPIVRDGQPAIDRELATDALTFFSDIFLKLKAAPPSAPSDGYRQIMEGFRTGQTGMIWHHTGSLQEVKSSLAPQKQFSTALVPAGPKKLVTRVAYVGNGISTDLNIDAAWEWLKFWGDADVAITLLEETGYFPASIAALKDERISGDDLYIPATRALEVGVGPLTFVGYATWAEKVVTPAFQSVLTRQSKPREAADVIANGLEAAVH